MSTQAAPTTDDARFTRLRRYNVIMGGIHGLQAVIVLALATSFLLPVTGTFLAGPPGSTPEPPLMLFSINVAWGVALFLFLSAGAHAIIASGWYFPRYRAGLIESRNTARWVEYSLSSSIMIILIAELTGITDVAALIALFGVNVSMILFGLVQEKYQTPGDGGLLPFWLGCIAGIFPWIAIGVYLVTPGSSNTPPAFVYVIFFSLFVFFNCFAVNQWLQYKQIGKWRDYLYGETVYITLSLVAKSLLAWQIFSATLAPTS